MPACCFLSSMAPRRPRMLGAIVTRHLACEVTAAGLQPLLRRARVTASSAPPGRSCREPAALHRPCTHHARRRLQEARRLRLQLRRRRPPVIMLRGPTPCLWPAARQRCCQTSRASPPTCSRRALRRRSRSPSAALRCGAASSSRRPSSPSQTSCPATRRTATRPSASSTGYSPPSRTPSR